MPDNINDKEKYEYEEVVVYEEYDEPLFHPTKILLYLILAGLVMVFIGVSFSYAYTRAEQGIPPIEIPFLFVLNTVVLILSSLTIHQANTAYQMDDTVKYQKSLLYTIVLTIAFMLLQILAFWQLVQANDALFSASDTARSYLQVVSGLHFTHVFAGLPFLLLFYRTAKKRMVEPVSVLVYFSDPEKRIKLKLLTIYWHFLDVLWVYLVLFFWINWLIQ